MLKNRQRITTTLSFDTKKRLDDYSEKSLISMSKIIEISVNEYLDKMEKQDDK